MFRISLPRRCKPLHAPRHEWLLGSIVTSEAVGRKWVVRMLHLLPISGWSLWESVSREETTTIITGSIRIAVPSPQMADEVLPQDVCYDIPIWIFAAYWQDIKRIFCRGQSRRDIYAGHSARNAAQDEYAPASIWFWFRPWIVALPWLG